MSSFLTHPDRHKTHANIAILAVLLLVAVVGWVTWSMVSDTSTPVASEDEDEVEEEQIVDVSPEMAGYVYFTSYETDTRRPYPVVYDISTEEVKVVENDQDTFYQEIFPYSQGLAYLQAPYHPREDNPFAFTHQKFIELNVDDTSYEMSVFLPNNLTWSESGDAFAFQGISRDFVEEEGAAAVFDPENLNDMENWSVYIQPVDSTDEPEEVVRGAVSPSWPAQTSDGIYFLQSEGVHHVNLETDLLTQVAGLPRGEYVRGDAVLVPNSRLAISDDGDELFFTFLSGSAEHDYVFGYELTDTLSADLTGYWRLPIGTHTDFTISPDANYGVFALYDLHESDSITLRMLDLQQESTTEAVNLSDLYTITDVGSPHIPTLHWSFRSVEDLGI